MTISASEDNYIIMEAHFPKISEYLNTHNPQWWKSIHRSNEVFLLLCFLCLITGLVFYKVVFITNISFAPSFWTFYGIITTFFLISRIPYAYLYEDNHNRIYTDSLYPNVSIVIAAKNEQRGILRTINTCIASRYPGKIECIVVDDGSVDDTKGEIAKAQKLYGEKVKLIVFSQNRGKREAMAAGINEAHYDIIIFVDSDSFLASDAIRHITEHFLANKQKSLELGLSCQSYHG